jgi:hypothetical protein
MFGTRSAAILVLASLSAPAMAAPGGFCDRIAAKLAAPTVALDDIEILEHDLRLSIRRAAEDGCDPYGGSMAGNEYCAAHVTHIRQQIADIQQADLREPDDRDTLQAMYDGANCGGREPQRVVRLGDEVDLVRGRVLTVAPDGETIDQPDAARFAALDDVEPEPAPDASVHTASIQAPPIPHIVSEPVPIPDDRRDVRVIGSRFLTDADSTRAFKTIATSDLDLPTSLLNRVLAWIGLGDATPAGAASALAEAPSAPASVVR